MTSKRFALLPLALAALLLSACTTKTENYCDGSTPCAAGSTCDLVARRCITAAQPDSFVPPSQPDSGPSRPDAQVESDTLPSEKEAGAAGPEASVAPSAPTCTDDSACASGLCVDGYCCESECQGSCQSCAVPGSEGKCTPVPTGKDPRGDCAGSSTDCLGSCDGSGACAFPDATKSCGATTCAAGELSLGSCDAKGGCAITKKSCGGLACADGASCKTSCAQDADCLGTDVTCLAGICTAVKPNGSACGTNGKLCKSGNCVDGICCDTACGSACHACNLPGKAGTCSPEPNGVSCGTDSCTAGLFKVQACLAGTCKTTDTPCFPYVCAKGSVGCGLACGSSADCAAGAYCDAAGKCQLKKKNGVACGGSGECESALCTQKEKVCCNAECGGDCESCTGKSSCLPFPAGTNCGPTDECKDDPAASFISIWQCNGTAGSCQQQKTDCGGFKCGAGLTCRTSCSQHQDCVSGLCELWTTKTCAATTAVCHVDSKATSAGQGTLAAPFKTISACLAQQAAKISVADGTYDEDLHFTSPALLVAKNASTTPGAPPKVYIRPVSQGVRVTANGVKLQAVQIEGHAGASGVTTLLEASAAIELISVRLMSAQGDALVLASTAARLEAVRIGYAKTGGIHATASILDVQDVTIERSGGIGLRSDSGTVKGRNLKIFDSGSVGFLNASALDLQNVHAQGNGTVGIFLVTGSSGKAMNLLVTNNGSYGITAYDVNVTLSYATVTNNNSNGTQLWCVSSTANPAFKNSILWSGKGQARSGSGCSFEGSDLDENLGGNNYTTNPLFVQPTAPIGPSSCAEYSCFDYRLRSSSLCINKGVTLAPEYRPATDLDGKSRINGPKADSGAYEY